MITTLSNNFLDIEISTLGAELTSVKTKDGKERLWIRDKNVWNGQAPILFPWTGRITNKKFTHKGKEYEGTNHGFLRNTEHTIIKQSDEYAKYPSVTLSTNGNLEKYPFEFYFEQRYTLIDEKIIHSVQAKNTGTTEMLFGLGFHPGFLCPFSPDKQTTDYELVFDTEQSPDHVCVEQGHPTGKIEKYMENKKSIQLTDTLFKNDSLNLTSITAKTMSLQEKGSLNRIEVSVENFPYLLLWSTFTPTVQFVCIEPWHTLGDFENASSEWTEKKNLLKLGIGETFSSEISMSFFFE